MKDYNLCDIHFHTNNSFDVFGQRDNLSNLSNIINMLSGDMIQNNVKLVCFTYHNIFIYNDYLVNTKGLVQKGIKCLPGIEINTTGNVHWLLIFDDIKLQENKDGQTIGKN